MRLYLFAHQDDEFALLQSISEDVNAGKALALVYLTDGRQPGVESSVRNAESCRVLASVGVRSGQIYFLGLDYGLSDGSLHLKIDLAWQGLQQLLNGLPEVDSVYMPAWEGGHQDHDVVHVLGLCVAHERACLDVSRQVALYHGRGLPWFFYRVLAPLPENGLVMARPIPWRQRWHFLRLFFYYRSQLTTWIGLYPFVLANMLVIGAEKLQPVNSGRVKYAPHPGRLLYEKRGFCTYMDWRACIDPFLRRQFPDIDVAGDTDHNDNI